MPSAKKHRPWSDVDAHMNALCAEVMRLTRGETHALGLLRAIQEDESRALGRRLLSALEGRP